MSIAYSGLFAAALVSLILTVVSVFFLGKRGPWGSIWSFFLVLFLILATVSIYVAPIGPEYWGVAWIPITIAGILVTILLIAAMPHPDYGNTRANKTEDVTRPVSKSDLPATPVGRFFWVLIILFAIAIMVGMMNPQPAL
jgi:hypothetical protein